MCLLIFQSTNSVVVVAQDEKPEPVQVAEEPTAVDKVKEATAWAKRTVEGIEIRAEQTDEPLKLRKGSLLRWSNPIVGEVYGDSFLWTDHEKYTAIPNKSHTTGLCQGL